MSNFKMSCSCKMNGFNFLLQNKNDLLITESHFPNLDPLNTLEHFAAVHLYLKRSSLWLHGLQGSVHTQAMQFLVQNATI